MSEALITALVVSVGPTLAGIGAYLHARGANLAVNHVAKGDMTLMQSVVQVREDVVELREDVVGVRGCIVAIRAQSDQVLHLAGNAVMKIDALQDRTADIEEDLADTKAVALAVRHDLTQLNEVDTLGREGRIDRRSDPG